MPDANDQPTEPVVAEKLFEEALSLLPALTRNAFLHCHHPPNPDEIKRLAQRLRVKLWKDDYRILRKYRQEASLSTYLQKTANREALHLLLEGERGVPLDDLPMEMIEQPPQQEEELSHQEQLQLLERAVKRLKPQRQELYNMVYREELSVEEIAQRLGRKPEAVWQLICRLRKRLTKLLRKK
jgi:RNA polymerase sigma factor (sigma-70 family)